LGVFVNPAIHEIRVHPLQKNRKISQTFNNFADLSPAYPIEAIPHKTHVVDFVNSSPFAWNLH
jgi:hypothetical protein